MWLWQITSFEVVLVASAAGAAVAAVAHDDNDDSDCGHYCANCSRSTEDLALCQSSMSIERPPKRVYFPIAVKRYHSTTPFSGVTARKRLPSNKGNYIYKLLENSVRLRIVDCTEEPLVLLQVWQESV